MTEINVLRLVLFIQYQFKCCGLIYYTTLGPSGHGKNPPSSRLGTLHSCYRQCFMTKIHVFRVVLLVQRQFKRWGLISNTTLGPSGHGWKPPSSKLWTLYSHCRQWFITEINVLRLSLPWASIHWLVQCTLECLWNATDWPSVHWETTGELRDYLQGTLEHHWKNLDETAHTGIPLEKLSWNCPTLGCHWINSNFCSLHWNTTGGTVTAHTLLEQRPK